jgi:hypothetical protein
MQVAAQVPSFGQPLRVKLQEFLQLSTFSWASVVAARAITAAMVGMKRILVVLGI